MVKYVLITLVVLSTLMCYSLVKAASDADDLFEECYRKWQNEQH